MSQRNAIRLRECTNPRELVALLPHVWRLEADEASPIPLFARQGVVHDLDSDELLFFSDEIYKKLMALMQHPAMERNAKNAAVDTFTWFCTLQSQTKKQCVYLCVDR